MAAYQIDFKQRLKTRQMSEPINAARPVSVNGRRLSPSLFRTNRLSVDEYRKVSLHLNLAAESTDFGDGSSLSYRKAIGFERLSSFLRDGRKSGSRNQLIQTGLRLVKRDGIF